MLLLNNYGQSKNKIMTNSQYEAKAKELTDKYKTNVKVDFTWDGNAYLRLSTADKAKTLKQMNVAKGFRVGFNSTLF